MKTWHSSERLVLVAATFATVPYLAINLSQIVLHDGSFIHFSKGEAIALTCALALLLWIGSALILLVCATVTKANNWLFGISAAVIFTGAAMIVNPRFWTHFFDLLNDGLAEWIFRVGVLSALIVVIFRAKAPSAR